MPGIKCAGIKALRQIHCKVKIPAAERALAPKPAPFGKHFLSSSITHGVEVEKLGIFGDAL